MNARTIGSSFAATAAIIAVASVTAATPAFAKGGASVVHCYGINSCKGTSDCKSGAHECKGQNDCKGQGFKALSSAKACAKAGGSLTEAH